MKKIISVILCIITCFLIFTLCTPVTLAASYSGTCSSGITWSLDTADGILTITGSGDMADYTTSTTPSWDRYQNYIKSVVFDRRISSVGAYTFYNGGKGYKYKKLTSVDLGEVESIGQYAFRGCASIDTITNADNVIVINDYAFLGCSSLTSVPFTSAATISNGAFSYCTGLTEINLPTNLRKIGSTAFENCTSASAITLSANITSIGDRAFSDCTAVTSVVFNSRNLSTVGAGIFEGSGTQTGAVLTIADNISTIPAKMFSYFIGLTTVQGGEGISTINSEAFAHTGITGFHVGHAVSEINETAFADTMSLEAFTVDENNTTFSATSSGILLEQGGRVLVRYPGGKTDTSYTIPSNITALSDGAFRESKYLKNFTAGSSISAISNSCFINSPALTNVSLDSSVKNIGIYAFANCKSLNSVSMNGVTTIGNYSFAQCDSLPPFTSSANLKIIGTFAFYDCDGITSVTITSGANTVGSYAFYQCRQLRSVSIASTVKTIADGAFAFCSSLNSVSLSNGLTTVGQYAFIDCPNLLSVKVPSTVTSIGKWAFGYKEASGSSAKVISGFKLYGSAGSAAQTYASSGGFSYEIVSDSISETVIDISDSHAETESSNVFSILLEKLSLQQSAVINWILNLFNKIYSFFAGIIRG